MRYTGRALELGDIFYPGWIIMSGYNRTALIAQENKMIRRLRFLVELTFATIAQDHSMTLEQAWEHVQALKTAAVTMFPGKEHTFDLVYLPRFSRLLAERFRANGGLRGPKARSDGQDARNENKEECLRPLPSALKFICRVLLWTVR